MGSSTHQSADNHGKSSMADNRSQFQNDNVKGRLPIPLALGISLSCSALFAIPIDNRVKNGAPSATLSGQPAASSFSPTLPTVMPFVSTEALPVTPLAQIAFALNSSIPIRSQGAGVARPFLWAGSTVDRERATGCLAATGFYEAGTDPAEQRAVMQVVLNRVRHGNFPRSVCGVVFQGSQRSTGCQFTFTCDGAMQRRRPSPLEWERARQVALEMLTGRTEPIVGNATHYHTNWVHPYWSSQMQKIAAVDTHLFFRWRGRPGNPQAFSNAYAGGEPNIDNMAAFSTGHQTVASMQVTSSLPSTLVTPALPIAPMPTPARASPALAGSGRALPDQAQAPDDDIFFVLLERSADSDHFRRMAEQSCAGKPTCRYLGWTNGTQMARRFPISGSAIDALSFSYIRLSANEAGRAQWNCAEFPRDDQAQCLRRGR